MNNSATLLDLGSLGAILVVALIVAAAAYLTYRGGTRSAADAKLRALAQEKTTFPPLAPEAMVRSAFQPFSSFLESLPVRTDAIRRDRAP
jgi:hypothetical protein